MIAAGGLIAPTEVPERFRAFAYNGSGDSIIVDPRGEIVARAPRGEEAILTYEADHSVIRSAKAAIDIAGDYSDPRFQASRCLVPAFCGLDRT